MGNATTGERHDPRVFVLDPHPISGRGICGLISRSSDFVVAGSATSLEEALGILEGLAVDLILVEPLAAPNDEAALIRALAGAAPAARLVALSARREAGYVRRVLDAGAAAFISKTESGASVLRSVRGALGAERP